MSAAPRLMLKQPSGWFAAGWEFGEAMTVLSDAGFKLFVWVCLNADRHTGQIRLTTPEIVRGLRKPEAWVADALRELEQTSVCRWTTTGSVEVTERYWPYEKQAAPASVDYVAQVRKLLSGRACVRCRFSPADEKLARQLQENGVTVAQIERAIWLGCSRKYSTMLANGGVSMPIASLSYFRAVIDEVCANSMPESYWAYVRRTLGELERQWLERTAAGDRPPG
ncbi:MAG: hypothetical protein R2729_26165 [Bryobacteraceae bacterium]